MGDYTGTCQSGCRRSKWNILREHQIKMCGGQKYLLPLLLGFSLLNAWLFALRTFYIALLLFGTMVAAHFLGQICSYGKSEQRKFSDVNSYMQQFMSAMILHRRIAAALEEVYLTFPDGLMHDTLQQMIWVIRREEDLVRAQKEAFRHMEETYPDEQLRFIHDFALRVEARGGDFKAEMELLSRMRQRHEKRIEHCQSNMKITAYTSSVLYVVMIFICVLVQRMMPQQLSVLSASLSQTSEVLLVLLFYLFLYLVANNMAKGWMRQEKQMGDKRAKQLCAYIDKWRPQGEKRGPGAGRWMIWHRAIYWIRFRIVRNEICHAVPKWLFDVCLLMQKYNITVSITESLRTAPAILKKEIQKLLESLRRDPSDIRAYAHFCEEYEISSVTQTTRMLMAIQNGAALDTQIQMQQLIAHNMDMLDELDAREATLRDAVNVRYNIYPMIPGAIVMAGYLFSMVMRIFATMSALI